MKRTRKAHSWESAIRASLSIYRDRGEFDGTIASARECLEMAGYEWDANLARVVQRVCAPARPTFIGKTWTLETERKGNRIAGYATHATSANTVALNDSSYPSAKIHLPMYVVQKLRAKMRARARLEGLQK